MDGAALMRNIVAGFEKSDVQPLLDAIHEDIVWKSANRNSDSFRFQGDYRGRAGVLDVLAKIAMDYTFHNIKPKEILSIRDVVWGIFDVGLLFEPKGKGLKKSMQLEIAIRWRLKDDKIIEHQAFFDTASLLLQQGLMALTP